MSSGPSRRGMLGMAAAATGGLAAAASAAPAAPAVARGYQAGRAFRAWVRHGTECTFETLRLKGELQPGEVLIRMTGSCCCYSITPTVLGKQNVARAMIPNHSGVGIVEAVGSQVRRCKVGDRVVASGTPQCGHCYECLHGHPEACAYFEVEPMRPMAEMRDGTGVVQMTALGGLSEIMVALEEYCIPVFTDLPHVQVAMLGDTFAVGVSAVSTYAPVEMGSDVAIFGAGPVGLAACQGARARSAGQIIVVEPVKYRREKALAFGATTVLDPNAEGDGLVDRIRALCVGPNTRRDAGGRVLRRGLRAPGADFVVEASGGDAFPPKVEAGPDPTGVRAIRQAWEATGAGGHLTTLSIGHGGREVSFPASVFSISMKSCHGGQMGGMHVMRDTPRYIKMMERGQIDCGAIITSTRPLDQVPQAFQAVADRTELGVVITFPE